MSIPIDDVTVPGWNFDAWPANSMVTLVNVPWSNTYRDAVLFQDRGALNAYIDDRVTEQADIITNMSYVPTNRPIRLHDPENRFYRYNYLRVSNPTIPGTNDRKKDYYYFITDIQFLNGDTTLVTVQLDVFQTFIYDVTFGNCYIERGHISLANTNRFNNYGRDYLTVPEGLEAGSNYVNAIQYSKPLIHTGTADYLICSTVSLTVSDFGSESNPRVITASGGLVQGLRSGASYYIVKGENLDEFMSGISKYPWIAQGIISITAIPPVTRYVPSYNYDPVFSDGLPVSLAPTGAWNAIRYTLEPGVEVDWREAIRSTIPSRYRNLDKFLTAPYSMVELTTYTGTPLELRPEAWHSDDLEVEEYISLPLPNQRIAIAPRNYNSGNNNEWGDGLDRVTQVTNLPQVAIVNDNATLTLASQAHSIAYSRESADWSQQKALRGNALSYDQATAATQLSTDTMNVQQQAAQQQLANQSQWANNDAFAGTVKSGVMGAAGGAVLGPAGAVLGGLGGLGAGVFNQITTGIQNNRNAETMALQQGAAQRVNSLQGANANYVRDTNKSLSDWAAKGDYENTIAGINAKIQDAQVTPPSIVGQIGGEVLNVVHPSGQTITARLKRIDDAHISMIGEYWLRYGYAVNRFVKPTTLHCMSKFTYWKMSETYIGAAPMPETYKQAIRGIFEKGVTIWRNPDEIGNVDAATNNPVGGISY